MIFTQEMNLNLLHRNVLEKRESELKTEKKASIKQEQAYIASLDEKGKRMLMTASESGALPLKSLRYTLNEQESCDAICLRYGWAIHSSPIYCG